MSGRVRARIVTPAVTILALVVASGCSGTGPAQFAAAGQQRDTSSEAGGSGSSLGDGEVTQWFDLDVGQCIDEPLAGDSDQFAVVACDAPHLEEIVGAVTIGAAYPGDDHIEGVSAEACDEAFVEATGVSYDDSMLDLWWVVVREADWTVTDPQAICSVSHPDADLTDPVRVDPHRLRDPGTGEVAAAVMVWWSKVRPGDCVLEESVNEVEYETLVPCSAGHVEEVYAEVELPAGEFPGDDAIFAIADDECARELDEFVHPSIRLTSIDYTYFYPNAESWAAGDREIQCRAVAANGGTITGSLAEAGATTSP
jgi:hypothetical protein